MNFLDLQSQYAGNHQTMPVALSFNEDTKMVSMNPRVHFIRPSIFSERHYQKLAVKIKDMMFNGQILQLGSGAGHFLSQWENNEIIGVEPWLELVSKVHGYQIYQMDWTRHLAYEILTHHGQMDVVVASNFIAYETDPLESLKAVWDVLKPDGLLIMEDPSLADIYSNGAYEQFYTPRNHFFSVISLNRLLREAGLTMVRLDKYPISCGINRVYAMKTSASPSPFASVKKWIEFEELLGLHKTPTYLSWANQIHDNKHVLHNYFSRIKISGKKLGWYDSSTEESGMLFNFLEIPDDLFNYFARPKTKELDPNAYFFASSWYKMPYILVKERQFLRAGGKFITHAPKVRFVY